MIWVLTDEYSYLNIPTNTHIELNIIRLKHEVAIHRAHFSFISNNVIAEQLFFTREICTFIHRIKYIA